MGIAPKTVPVPLARALEQPRGARFRRCALQVNPYDYVGRHRKVGGYPSEAQYNAALVQACLDQGIEAIAVTDHFRVSSSAGLASVARDAGITVFPGFEAVSKEGVHFLCLFDPDRSVKEIDRIIGECGVILDHLPSPIAEIDSEELLAKAKRWDAVIVAAHVTSKQGGLLRKLTGQSRKHIWQLPELQAIAIPGSVDDLSQSDRAIVGCKGDYRREHPIAVINAADICAPKDIGASGAWTWIKMTELTIDGLRQAVLDPNSRIRLASTPVPDEHTEFVAMAWEGGFLDQITLHFSENLNVLIGGRGAGKSTIVESLRYVLGLNPLGDEATRLHEGIVRNVLQAGTKVSLLICMRRPGESWYAIERTVPNPPIIRDAEGNVVDLQPVELMRGIEIFGQHEISELTKSEERLTRLLDRFVKHDDSLRSHKAAVKRELTKTRRQLADALQDLDSVQEQLAALPALESTLKRFQAAGIEGRLREQSELVREERVLDTADERVEQAAEALQALGDEVQLDTAFLSTRSLKDLPAKRLLRSLDKPLQKFNIEASKLAGALEAELERLRESVAGTRERWAVREKKVTAAYEKILRELQEESIDGDEFISLRRQIEELEPLRDRRKLIKRSIKELEQSRRNLLAEWDDLRTAEFQGLNSAAKRVSRALRKRIRVTVHFDGDRSPLATLLKREVGGRLAEAIEILDDESQLSLREFADAARNGSDALVKSYGLPTAQAENIANAGAELVMELEELDLPPTTRIELNVAAEGGPARWQPLGDLSTGQKATAVLLLLLNESNFPLVIDQPEDDLDNRFITEGIVPRMREEKRRRQFVFSTHNANIPVLGDAELILGLTASGEAGERGKAEVPSKFVGSIDSEPVRELVEELLEGGREAFETRRRKYGF